MNEAVAKRSIGGGQLAWVRWPNNLVIVTPSPNIEVLHSVDESGNTYDIKCS